MSGILAGIIKSLGNFFIHILLDTFFSFYLCLSLSLSLNLVLRITQPSPQRLNYIMHLQ